MASKNTQRHRRIVLLPGWWFELLCSGAAAGVLIVGVRVADLPNLLGLLLFVAVLLTAETSTMIFMPAAVVDSSFMTIMAAIAAFGAHGAVLGACILRLAEGVNVGQARRGRYTGAPFNGNQ